MRLYALRVGRLVAQSTATLALLELSFQRLVATPAAPGGLRVVFGVQNFVEPCACARKLPIVHNPEFGPALDKRQFSGTPGEQLVLDEAVDALRLQAFLEKANHHEAFRGVDSFHGAPGRAASAPTVNRGLTICPIDLAIVLLQHAARHRSRRLRII